MHPSTNLDLKGFSEYFTGLAKDYYRESPELDGKMIVYAESIDPEKSVMWIVSFNSDNEKRFLMHSLSLAMNGRGATRYALATLSWYTEVEPVTMKKLSSEKKEAFFSVAVDDNESKSDFYHVIRVKDRITEYVEQESDFMKSITGFDDLLRQTKTTQPFPPEVYRMADGFLAPFILQGKPMGLPANSKPKKFH